MIQNPNEKVQMHHIKRAIFNVNNNVCALGFFLINITVQSISLFMVRTKPQACRRLQDLTNPFKPTLLADLGWTATKAQLHTVVSRNHQRTPG